MSQSRCECRLLEHTLVLMAPTLMKPLPMPFRLLDSLAPQPTPIDRGVEPVLGFDRLPPSEPMLTPPLRRRAIELELEEGSRRFYLPMAEAQVVERARR